MRRVFIITLHIISMLFSCVPSSLCLAAGHQEIYKEIADEKGEFACLSPKEASLLKYINQFRSENGLPAVVNSRSLNKVARMHAVDLNTNHPEKDKDPRGLSCTMHSWSNFGAWTPVCYTSDHKYLNKMLSKPSEITKQVYDDPGYENVYWSSVENIFPRRVLQSWQNSPGHKALILESGIWQKVKWQALGVGIYKNFATIWVGSMVDPKGPQQLCAEDESGK